MEKKKDLPEKSNSGFSLITVILAVGLVGILVMLIAYMVIANFRMKMSGLREKDAFYTAERALEEIRTGLQEDVAEAMSEAYTNVMESYNENVKTGDVTMDVQRQAAYEREFLSILQTRLRVSNTNNTHYNIAKLREYVDLDKEDSFDSEKESLIVTAAADGESSSSSAVADRAKMTVSYTKKNITIKNLKVMYVDARGYAAIIRTNIQLDVPPIQYPTPSTLPDLMNMIVVAGKGIYCASGNATGTQTGDNEIQGSVYAGILPEDKLKVNGQAIGVKDASIYLASGRTLNISKGERTVCAGEVTLAQNSAFYSLAETTLWAQGVNVTSAKAELLGKTYLSDDLTIKAGTGSYVKLAGEYYGYGDVESALKSHNSVEYGYPNQSQNGTDTAQTPSTTKTYEKKTASALSSAITINGKSTTLDLSNLDRLLLAGKNYIASKALSKTNSSETDSNTGNSDDVMTGESLTVKGTQIAYLVPDSLLETGTGDYHNPMDYNGMKLVREGARPISGDTGLRDVQRLAEANDFPPVDETKRGRYQQINLRDAYVDHLFGYINVKNLTPLKLVINSGNGAAGPVVDAIEARFKALGAPVELIKVHNTPDGNFPNGIPNPLLPECRDDTRNAVIKHGADMGIAFDGDFDRCFLFDEKGQFIEGYYIVGLLAEAFLEKNPGAKIIHDPRLSWNTVDVVTAAGGTPVMSKTGHAFIKERMRKEDAIYGGEMSAHHYFRDFAYCDSGMIPWLLVAELVCLKGKTLGELVRDRMAAFPASGEINSKLAQPVEAINRVEQHFSREALAVDRTDGISMTFADWRFNLRTSNTEPVVRLNVESRGDVPLMEARTRTLLTLLNE